MKKVKASNISRFTKRLLPVDALAEVAQVCAEFSNINSYKSRQKQCKESAQTKCYITTSNFIICHDKKD